MEADKSDSNNNSCNSNTNSDSNSNSHSNRLDWIGFIIIHDII